MNLKLHASAAYRWQQCPGSLHLIQHIPESWHYRPWADRAERGTQIHAMAEAALNDFKTRALSGDTKKIEKKKLMKMCAEIDGAYDMVDTYLDAVRIAWKVMSKDGPAVEIHIEEKTRLSHYRIDSTAKADCLLYCPASGAVAVFDIKTGNFDYTHSAMKQLEFGALLFIQDREIKSGQLSLYVVQPAYWKTDQQIIISRAPYDLASARTRYNVLIMEARQEEYESGDHCGMCPCLALCPYMVNLGQALKVMASGAEIATIQKDVLEKIYLQKKNIESFLKAIENVITERLEAGESSENIMIGTGYGHRRWMDPEAVREKLAYLGDDLYEPKKMKSPAQVEYLAGKENIKGLYVTPEIKKLIPRKSQLEALIEGEA